jgi:hypothetical protein
MGLANNIHTGVGIKQIIAEVFPEQQQHRRKQKA